MPIFESVEVEIIQTRERAPKMVRRSKIDTVVFYLLTAIAFLLPLFFIPYVNISLEAEKSLFLALALGASFFLWLLARLALGSYSIPKSGILLAGVGLLAAFVVSALFSPALNTSLTGFIYDTGTVASIFMLVLLLLLVSIVFQSKQKVFAFYGALFLSFGVLFLFHLIRLIFGPDVLAFGVFSGSADSILGKWNDFGVFAGMITLLSLMALEFLTLEGRRKYLLHTFLWASVLILAIVNLYLTWMLIGIFSLVLLVYNLTFGGLPDDGGANIRKLSPAPLIVLVISFLFIIAGSSLGGFIAGYTNISQIEVRPSWSATMDIVKGSWKSNPILGAGPNRFTSEWLVSKPEAINQTIFWNTDFSSGIGLIPSFAVTTGLLGTLAWLLFLGLILYQGVRILFASPKIHYLTFSSFIVSLYLWLTAFFYVPNLTIFVLAFFMTGIFIAFATQQGLVKNIVLMNSRDPRMSFVSILVILVLLMGTVLWEYGSVQRGASLVYLERGGNVIGEEGGLERAEEYLIRASIQNESDTLYRALTEIERARLATLLSQTDAAPETVRVQFQEILGNAINAAQSAVSVDNTNYLNWLSLFQVYGDVVQLKVIEGAYDNALSSLARAILLNPKSPALILSQARLEIANGNSETAREFIEVALTMKNNYTDAIFLLAQLEIQDGNVGKAIASLETATFINPNDISLFFSLGLLKYNDKDYGGAVQALERVISLSPQYSNAKYFLGLSYSNLDETDLAITQFEGVLELNPGNEDVTSILTNLRSGRAPLVDPTPSSPEEAGEPPLEE